MATEKLTDSQIADMIDHHFGLIAWNQSQLRGENVESGLPWTTVAFSREGHINDICNKLDYLRMLLMDQRNNK